MQNEQVRKKCKLLLMTPLLCLLGCASSPKTYPDNTQQYYGAIGGVDWNSIPLEFRKGTASLDNVKAWSSSLLDPLDTNLDLSWQQVEPDASPVLFVSSPNWAGTGGNNYLIFQRKGHGYQFMSELRFGAICPMTRDSLGRIRVLTSSSAGHQCLLSVLVLKSDGFQLDAQRQFPCGDGSTNGPNPVDKLFDAPFVTDAMVGEVFATRVYIEPR